MVSHYHGDTVFKLKGLDGFPYHGDAVFRKSTGRLFLNFGDGGMG